MAGLLWYTFLAVISTALIWVGSVRLESASQRLADYYGLPPVVQGAMIAAVGSSFPELSSTVLATLLHGEFSLGVGAIVGSAVFNVLVIPGVSALYSPPLSSNRDLVYKEALFYMLSVAVLLVVFSLAVIYRPVPGARLAGQITRPLALVPVAVYGLYVFIQYQDTADHREEEGRGDRSVDVARQWLTLLVGLVLILVAVEGLVRAALGFGAFFGTPSFLWGLTVVAAGTSLPDAFVSIRAAAGGSGVTSLANVLGSNVFDLLVAIPAGILIAGATTVNFGETVPMMAFLTLATVVLFTALRTDLELSVGEAYGLLAVYGVFVAWLVLETAGIVSYVPNG